MDMAERRFDIVVAGGGAVGLSAAIAFARAGLDTCLVGPRADALRDGRTAALLVPSLTLMTDIGLASAIEEHSAPLRAMRIVDDTGSLFRPPPALFEAREIGRPAFGRNIENASLVDILARTAGETQRLQWLEHFALGVEGRDCDRVRLANGEVLSASLVVAADGRGSRLRETAGLEVRRWSYPQEALTTILAHSGEHGDVSTEFHTREGPFTLVPLPGRRSSVVWVASPAEATRLAALDDVALADTIERRSRRLLGRITIDGPRGRVPLGGMEARQLVSGRLALIGEAAHVLPPIGAQGLNLGLKDVATLRDLVVGARKAGSDIGAEPVVGGYARARRGDIGLRTLAVDGLNRALLSNYAATDLMRGFGLGALSRIGPLRRAVMRAGLMAGG